MQAKGKWTAVLLAGQRPGENVFARENGVEYKALIPVAGEPMLGRVVRALLACPPVGDIVILAQTPEALLEGACAWMKAEPRIRTAEAGGGISTSIAAIAGTSAAPWPVLVVTADHALLEPAMVDHFIAHAGDNDAALAVVERKVVEAEYPETRRTWIKFAGGHYSGANLFALTGPAAHKALALWSEVERDRKKALKLLWFFGPMLALRAATRTIGLDGALRIAGRKAGLRVGAVRLPFARAAIDVDKPADLALVEAILDGRPRNGKKRKETRSDR